MKYYLKEMRIKHYIKNFLIFLPLFFSGQLLGDNFGAFFNASIAFLAFCLISSAVYFINDINDIDKDRKHPTKKNRPIASGHIPLKSALLFVTFLIFVSIIFSYILFIRTSNFQNIIIVLAYLLVNVLYSVFHFKDIPLLDVAILMIGFVLRLYIGSTSTGIENSTWLYLVVIMGSFYLGFGKRKAEIMKIGLDNNTRESLKAYNVDFLDKAMYSCMTLSIAFFALWCKEKQDTSNNMLYMFLVPLIVMICFRYSMSIENSDSDGDPVNMILSDKTLLSIIFLTGICLFMCVYLG